MLGVKLESPEGVAHCEEILAVPGLAFAEMGPGDLGLALGYPAVPREPYPSDAGGASACLRRLPQKRRRLPRNRPAENIVAKLDEGVRVIAGHREETATIGRAHQKRTMPV